MNGWNQIYLHVSWCMLAGNDWVKNAPLIRTFSVNGKGWKCILARIKTWWNCSKWTNRFHLSANISYIKGCFRPCVFLTGYINEPQHGKTNKMTCADSEYSDQSGHPPGLIRVFAVRKKKHWVLSYPLSAQRWLIRLGGCPGWSESSLGGQVTLLLLFCYGSNECCLLISGMFDVNYCSNFRTVCSQQHIEG